MKNGKTLLIALTAAFIFTAGCTKEREERFSQGQGTNLDTIGKYESQEYELTTLKAIERPNTSKAEKLTVANGVDGVNYFQLVSYETTADLLGDVPFVGKEDTKYTIKYVLGPKFLKVVKIAPKELLPYQELPYATEISPGIYQVPLVGYNVSYYRIENQKNSNDEDTHIKVEVGVPSEEYKNASHIRVDLNSRKIFDAVAKIDVYPRDLFKGEWYYAETIIQTSEENRDDIGNSFSSIDATLEPATKIKFILSDDQIRAVNVNVAQGLSTQDTHNLRTVLRIPISWKEYRAKNSGSQDGLAEEEVDENAPQQRPYIQFDFEALKTVMNDGKDNQIRHIELDQDYIGITIEKADQNSSELARTIKYSFLRAKKRNYEPKKVFVDDQERFGYFVSVKPFIDNYKIHWKEDIENLLLINRFNPKNGKIVFYLSENTPDKFRPIAQAAVDAWDKAFKQAVQGTGKPPLSIVLHPKKKVSLGDLRYNVINLIESVSEGNLLGFGPSIVDPTTGETISATSNVHVTPIRSGLVSYIRRHIQREAGLLQGQSFVSHLDEDILAKLIAQNPDEVPPLFGGNLGKANASAPTPESSSSQSELFQAVDQVLEGQPAVASTPKYSAAQKMGLTGAAIKLNFTGKVPSIVSQFYPTQKVKLYRPQSTSPTVSKRIANPARMGGLLGKIAQGNQETLQEVVDSIDITQNLVPAQSVRSSSSIEHLHLHQHNHMETVEVPMIDPHQNESRFHSSLNTLNAHNIIRQIKKHCSEVDQYIDQLKQAREENPSLLKTSNELAVLESCSDKILAPKVISTLVHELGHNFSLAHNFMGSVDEANFHSTDLTQTEEVVRSSSVMEYTHFNEDRLTIAGAYDIAAIRYGYFDAIEDSEGNIQSLDPKKSIKENLEVLSQAAAAPVTAKKFLYCNDAQASLRENPMCDRHDAGITPLEKVTQKINDFWAIYRVASFRDGRIGLRSGDQVAMLHLIRTFIPLMRVYNEWRFHLADFLQQSGIEYLQGVDAGTYDRILLAMEQSPFAEEKKLYYPAASKVVDFFFSLIQLPDRYCFLYPQSATGAQAKIISLENVRDTLFSSKRVSVESCFDPEVIDFYAQATPALGVFAEYGFHSNDIRYPMDRDGLDEPLDVAGTGAVRGIIPILMGDRQSFAVMSINHIWKNFFPNMMDEPKVRERLQKTVRDRALKGVSINTADTSNRVGWEHDWKPETLMKAGITAENNPQFIKESGLISFLSQGVSQMSALGVPNDTGESLSRIAPFRVSLFRTGTDDPEVLQQASAVTQHEGVVLYASRPDATDTIETIKKINEIKVSQSYAGIDGALHQLSGLLPLFLGLPNRPVAAPAPVPAPPVANPTPGSPGPAPGGPMPPAAVVEKPSTATFMRAGILYFQTLSQILQQYPGHPITPEVNAFFDQFMPQLIKISQNQDSIDPSKPYEEVAAQLGIDTEFPLYVEDIMEALGPEGTVRKKLDTLKPQAEYYSAHQEEIDAQLDLLFRILIERL